MSRINKGMALNSATAKILKEINKMVDNGIINEQDAEIVLSSALNFIKNNENPDPNSDEPDIE